MPVDRSGYGTIVVARSTDSSVTALEVLGGTVETTGFAIPRAHIEVGRRVEVGISLDTPAQGRPCPAKSTPKLAARRVEAMTRREAFVLFLIAFGSVLTI